VFDMPSPDPSNAGQAGVSAGREYERRRQRREQHARAKLGGLGGFLARVIDELDSTKAWKRGAQGEARTAARLEKHLAKTGVRLLHDRRIPRRGNTNIDHLAIGPGGVTVIDSKGYHGKVEVDRVGGLFAPRRTILLINGRDRTSLVDGVERQVEFVRSALNGAGLLDVEIRAALCFPYVDGLPLIRKLTVRDVVIDGPKPVAKLTARRGAMTDETVDRLWRRLGDAFPSA
jgi:hypothetical protein